MNLRKVTENGEISFDEETQTYVVFDETYADIVCITPSKKLAEDVLKSYCDGLDGLSRRPNLFNIVKDYGPYYGKLFRYKDSEIYKFEGVLDSDEDIYYLMRNIRTNKKLFCSCVGSLEGHGFVPIVKPGA